MFRVCICYSTRDLAWASYLKQLLTAPGIEVFVAEHDLQPGTSLGSGIARQIDDAMLLILIWSKNAADSEYVGKEMFYARGRRKSILPVVIERGVALPSELGDLKYLDVAANPEPQCRWLRDHVAELAQSKAVAGLVSAGLLALLGCALYAASSRDP